jgi:hypothetical protein
VRGKPGKQRGRSAARSKGRRSAEVKQSHKKPDRPATPGQKRGHGGGNGEHGGGNGEHGGGNGDHGGGNGKRGGK